MPVVLIESDRGDTDTIKQKAFDFEDLKTAYNGGEIRGEAVFNRGVDVQSYLFRGSVVISQNATVDGSHALLSRIIHCHCTKAHFSPATKTLAQKFERAKIEDVAGFLTAALSQEPKILETFFNSPQLENCKTEKSPGKIMSYGKPIYHPMGAGNFAVITNKIKALSIFIRF